MAFFSNTIRDNGLSTITANGTEFYLTTQVVTTYAAASNTYTLGKKTGVVPGSVSDASGGGRGVVIPATTGGDVTDTGTATHWALCDPTNQIVLVSGALSASVDVVAGGVFNFGSFSIKIPAVA